MNVKETFVDRTLHFKQPAGTSRGVYTVRNVRYLVLTDEETGRCGVGECAPLPDLSLDNSAMVFARETALWHLQRGTMRLSDTAFSRGEQGIPINGLVWMGTFEEMSARIEDKLAHGFRCVKVKIGAIDFDHEVSLLRQVRRRFAADEVTLRLDANGAFLPDEALAKLRQLSAFDIHSIEQPIRQGQWAEMARLCRESPIPIALDEELIGRCGEKEILLDAIRPQFLVLKPSLHGGLSGIREWQRLACERGIDTWVTSALESNIGLNAIAHYCAEQRTTLPQGLGTGLLFTDNISSPLYIKGDCLCFDPSVPEPDILGWLGA